MTNHSREENQITRPNYFCSPEPQSYLWNGWSYSRQILYRPTLRICLVLALALECQLTNDPKWVWVVMITWPVFLKFRSLIISLKSVKLGTSNCMCWVILSNPLCMHNRLLRGHSTSFQIAPFDKTHTCSYEHSVVNVSYLAAFLRYTRQWPNRRF